MSIELTLPELGEGIEGGDVVAVLVSVGDSVQVDDSIIEIETDKATVEVPSTSAGTVEEILVSAGDNAKVGQVLVKLSGAEAAPAEKSAPSAESKPEPVSVPKKEPEKAAAPAAAHVSGIIDVSLPELGEGIESGEIVDVLVSVGDTIAKDDSIIEIETDKATVEVPSTAAGVVKDILVEKGKSAKVGSVLIRVEGVADAAPVKQAPKPASPDKPAEKAPVASAPAGKPAADSAVSARDKKKPVPASPSVRRLAFEIGVDIYQVPGTGAKGRIMADDVKLFAKKLIEGIGSSTGGGSMPTPVLPDFSKWGTIEEEKLSNIRRKTAEHMSLCWNTVAHVTQFDKADITELEHFRQQQKARVAAAGGKLTITAMLVKVAAVALKKFPKFNASIDPVNQKIIYKRYYNVGIAVDTDRGLLVPVIRDVDQKSIIQIAMELGDIAEKARDKKTAIEDLQGGTFTITNLGGIGGTGFTPIVNWPEVAILGIARSSHEPVFNKAKGEFEPRLMMPMCLSYDHRIIDGADGARFIQFINDALQQPMLLALEG
jgi:pyruvate dehydrogenase E2 component (dihydrolipoamide acetyltransferase)